MAQNQKNCDDRHKSASGRKRLTLEPQTIFNPKPYNGAIKPFEGFYAVLRPLKAQERNGLICGSQSTLRSQLGSLGALGRRCGLRGLGPGPWGWQFGIWGLVGLRAGHFIM